MGARISSAARMAAATALGLGGCAGILNETQQAGISRSPTRAVVDAVPQSNTPVFADLKSKTEHIVTLELPRYEKARLTLTRSVNGSARGGYRFWYRARRRFIFRSALQAVARATQRGIASQHCQHQPASRRLDADGGSAPRSFFAANRLTAGHQSFLRN